MNKAIGTPIERTTEQITPAIAMLLEQLLHVLVIQLCGLKAQSRPWLYYVYAALAAAVFEETGRLIAMKFWMKKWLDFPNALMYGIGHGGVEAILLGGFSGISLPVSSKTAAAKAAYT